MNVKEFVAKIQTQYKDATVTTKTPDATERFSIADDYGVDDEPLVTDVYVDDTAGVRIYELSEEWLVVCPLYGKTSNTTRRFVFDEERDDSDDEVFAMLTPWLPIYS